MSSKPVSFTLPSDLFGATRHWTGSPSKAAIMHGALQEALHNFCAEGPVPMKPHTSATVQLSPEEVKQYMEIRLAHPGMTFTRIFEALLERARKVEKV